jgi:hypothetical protein
MTGFAAGFHAGMILRTCFCGTRKSSMFAEMPLDNRTVNKFAALPPARGFYRPYSASPQLKRFNISLWLAVL